MSKSMKSSGYSTLKRKKFLRPPPSTSGISHAVSKLRLQVEHNHQGYIEMNLNGQNLTVLPPDITDFTRLEVLILSKNALTEIPDALSRLRRLRVLLLQENYLSQIPDTLTNCVHLNELNLTRNNLTSLPRNISAFKALTVLKLGQNHFESLPHDIGLLSNLCYLDLHGNSIWYLPFSLHGLRKLKYINLADNRFENLPLPVCQVTNLKVLNLRGNNLKSLAPDFEALKNLRELNLSHNHLDGIPKAVYKMKELRYLNVASNLICHIPHHIAGLQNLQVLHLQGNKISNFPNSFKTLQYLNIANNHLFNVSVVGLSHLKYVNVNNNFLENLPMGIYTLSRLESLRLKGNRIKYVSQDITQLRQLKILDLGNNKLTSFPQIIDQLHKLDYFNIKGNDIKHRMSLLYGQTPSSTVQDDQHPPTSNHHPYSHHWRKYLHRKSQSSRPPTRGTMMSKSQDLDELLQNGFSQRHLDNTSESVIWHLDKEPSHISRMSAKQSHVTDSRIKKDNMATDFKTSFEQSYEATPNGETDFRLLGICNQLEMLLNKQLLQPVLSVRSHPASKNFGKKSIVPVEGGMWRLSDKSEQLGVVMSQQESFTLTSAGGEFESNVEPRLSIVVPRKSITSGTLHVSIKTITIDDYMLETLKREDNLISDISSIGPIILIKTDKVINFNSQITMGIPMPSGDGKGSLHLVTIRMDNSCIPTSTNYQVKNDSMTLHAWQLLGKVAVTTKSRCKYKACSAVEQLLKHVATR